MQQVSPVQENGLNNSALPLLERMDDAVGEATTVMGAVLTELLRRTLRNGVAQIGHELNSYVTDQVDNTLAERTPAIEQAALEAADKTARAAATEVVVDEVRALESRARETDEQLAGRIEETAQHLTGRIEQTAQQLTGRIEETHKQVHETTSAA